MDVVLFSKEFEKKHGHKPNILWIAHRDELLNQADRDLSGNLDRHTQESDETRTEEIVSELQLNEQRTGNNWTVTRNMDNYQSGILVSSIQKLNYGENLEKFQAQFDYIVIDEAHHAYADSYMKVINKYPDAFILGLSATPERFSDRRNVIDLFKNIAIDKNIVDMVNQGHLTTLYFHKVETRITPLSDDRNNTNSDFQLSSYWRNLGAEGQKQRDQLVVDTYLKLLKQEGYY
jgi:superfamily II DNA or RNA helicase